MVAPPELVARFEDLVDLVGDADRKFAFVLSDGDVSDWVRQSYDDAKTLPVKRPKTK